MTPEELDAIEARAAAATPGPWRVVIDDSERPTTVWQECTSAEHPTIADPGRDYVFDDCRDGELHSEPFFREADAEFIAHARTDVPALLAEVERLRAAVERVRNTVEYYDRIGSAPMPKEVLDALDGAR